MAHLLSVKGPMDEKHPYEEFIEVEVGLLVDGRMHIIGMFPILVALDTPHNSDVLF